MDPQRTESIYVTCTQNHTHKIVGSTKDDQPKYEQLCNFTAAITKETRYIDGVNTKTHLTITGKKGTDELPTVTIPAERFPGMGWVTNAWGVGCVLAAGSGVKDDLRTAIQLMSDNVETESIYQHTGWTRIHERDVFLHATGGITATNNDPEYKVDLPSDLSEYKLPCPTKNKNMLANAVNNSLSLLHLAPLPITTVSIAATYRAAIGPADFAIHTTGPSGSFKSELASLMQSHYGAKMDARKLPGSWSSTANAMEALAYKAKNCLFTIDDYIPVGTSWQIKQYTKNADQLIRGQGNQQGRARLTDVSAMQQTMFPRGVINSTGEDTPEGQSLRGRMMIGELSKGDIDAQALTIAQSTRSTYPLAMAGFIQWIAQRGQQSVYEHEQALRDKYRDKHLGIGHTRTPSMVGDLLATAELLLEYATDINAINATERQEYWNAFQEGIKAAAAAQTAFIVEADPASMFVTQLQSMIASKKIHFANIAGGQPEHAHNLGWTETKSDSAIIDFRPCGTRAGWMNIQEGILYLDATIIFEDVRRHSAGAITITKATMFKRLKEARMLVKTDETRQRNTIRMTCDGQVRNVLAVKLSEIINFEQENDEQPF